MQFIQKYFAFPSQFGLMPYLLLLFLIGPIINIYQSPVAYKFFYYGLLLIFMMLYRVSYTPGTLDDRIIILSQLMISMVFAIGIGDGTLFAFVAWQAAFMILPRKNFVFYLVAYYVIGSFSIVYALYANGIPTQVLQETLFYFLMMPVISYVFSRSINHFIELNTDNKRLESVVKNEERTRISRDLHDNLGQSFSTITLKAELASKLIDKNPSLAKAQLKDIAQTSRDNLNIVRDIVSNLNEKNIPETMMDISSQLSLANIYLVNIKEDLAHDWSKKRQHVLSQVLQEAVNNIIRHSQATIVRIQFKRDGLTIHDNGRGLPKNYKEGNGVMGMHQRLNQIGGKLSISNKKGVLIEVRLTEGDKDD